MGAKLHLVRNHKPAAAQSALERGDLIARLRWGDTATVCEFYSDYEPRILRFIV